MVGSIKSKTNTERKKDENESIQKSIQIVDTSDLKSDFDRWPRLASDSWSLVKTPAIRSSPKSIVFSGLGGSGIIGELAHDIFGEAGSKTLVHVLKDYHLPAFIDNSSIVIGISCSGNTEETISSLYEASSKGIRCYAFGSGGELEVLSRSKQNFEFTRTNALKVPRSSLPGIFFPVLRFLTTNSLVDVSSKDIDESLQVLSKVQENCSNLATSKPLEIARKIRDSDNPPFPLVYDTRRTRAVGTRFRQSMNENAKVHAFDGTMPELCHNDIVGWDAQSSKRVASVQMSDLGERYPVILLRLPDDPPEIETRLDIVSDIVKKNGGRTIEAPCMGESYLARILSMLYFLDYASYYLAILRGVDPISTPSIDFLKSELKSRLGYIEKMSSRETKLIS